MRITDKEKGGLGIRQATGTTRATQKDGTQERMTATEKEQERVRKEPSTDLRTTDTEKGGLGIHRATGTARAKQKDGTKERMRAKEKEKERHTAKGRFP